MKRFLNIFCALALFANWVNAQTQVPAWAAAPPAITIVPASPDAASLGKYGDIPVGLYTGVPSITIPIWTIKVKGLEVPVNLSYHSGGIKTDELASSVGLGWALNFGGSITSSVNGKPDMHNNVNWTTQTDPNMQVPQTSQPQTEWGAYIGWGLEQSYLNMYDFATGKYDTQPDIYYASYNGKSVKFFFKEGTNQIVTMPYSRVGIGRIGDSFIVSDENNVSYNFSSVEQTRTSYTSSGGVEFITRNPASLYINKTFYPTTINSPNGGLIQYDYEGGHYTHFSNQVSASRYMPVPNQNPDPPLEASPPAQTYTSSTTYVEVPKRISKIRADGGLQIIFIYGLARADLAGADAITQVLVKDTINNNTLATYNLNYDNDSSHLRLLSVQKVNEGTYALEYDGENVARLSHGQDHWGYSNGADGNYDLLPYDQNHGFFTGADRSPNVNALTGLLKKITYPTGGYTNFEYENNTASITHEKIDLHSATIQGEYGTHTANIPFTVGTNALPLSFRAFFNLPTLNEEGVGDYTDPETGEHYQAVFQVRNSSNQTIGSFAGTSADNGNFINALPPGNYNFFMSTHGSVDFSSLYLYIQWNETDGMITENQLVGGARIKTVSSYPLSGVPVIKHYVYTKADSPLVSSGVVNWSPNYVITQPVYKLNYNQNYLTAYFYFAQSTASVAPLGSIQGGPVGYTEVAEYTEAQTKGYSLSKFTVVPDVFSHPGNYPSAPSIAYDCENGLLTEKRDYSYQGGSYHLIKKTVNNYTRIDNPVTPRYYAMTVTLLRPGYEPGFSDTRIAQGPLFGLNYYGIESFNKYLSSAYTTDYDPADSTRKVLSSQKLYYGNPYHQQPTWQEISKGTGEKYRVVMRYEADISSPTTITTGPEPVLERRVMVNDGTNNRVVRDEVTRYADGLFPVDYYNMKLTAPVDSATVALYDGDPAHLNSGFEKRIAYGYGSNYTIVAQSKDDLQNAGYQWGYNNQYVIAECKNALNTEFYTQNYEELSGATVGNAHTGNKYGTSAAISWTRPNARAYVIDYWYLDGTVWKFRQDNYTADTYNMVAAGGYDDVRIYPADAQMTTYTHKPFFGMTSAISPRGQTTYYEYDSSQRLINVRDQDGNIVKHTDYHYANQ